VGQTLERSEAHERVPDRSASFCPDRERGKTSETSPTGRRSRRDLPTNTKIPRSSRTSEGYAKRKRGGADVATRRVQLRPFETL
jgi:hypothetical protein